MSFLSYEVEISGVTLCSLFLYAYNSKKKTTVIGKKRIMVDHSSMSLIIQFFKLYMLQLCHQSMRKEPHLYRKKSLYAKNVEVQDYKLLCIARVELKEEKFTLVGILGGWWALPRLFSLGFPMVRDRDLKHY
ncbi:hypothetical protein I3842_04G027800 [Carya illinoinensis]|uniref:Uncharacterized protein n=1 Tax=Carya illinoinensis TaxID=32201 RepID=A0A922JPY8_CARIL|nr:hypothetical protein I3842_04G027800 [Carya illinoinensis]